MQLFWTKDLASPALFHFSPLPCSVTVTLRPARKSALSRRRTTGQSARECGPRCVFSVRLFWSRESAVHESRPHRDRSVSVLNTHLFFARWLLSGADQGAGCLSFRPFLLLHSLLLPTLSPPFSFYLLLVLPGFQQYLIFVWLRLLARDRGGVAVPAGTGRFFSTERPGSVQTRLPLRVRAPPPSCASRLCSPSSPSGGAKRAGVMSSCICLPFLLVSGLSLDGRKPEQKAPPCPCGAKESD